MAFRTLLCRAAALSAVLPAYVQPARAQSTLDGPFAARVVRVVDGDTLQARVRIWLDQDVQVLVRLRGIDAPELYGPCAEAGQAARAALAGLVGDNPIVLRRVSADKYGGRVDADVLLADNRDAAQTLVRQGHARPWTGKGKRPGCGSVTPSGR